MQLNARLGASKVLSASRYPRREGCQRTAPKVGTGTSRRRHAALVFAFRTLLRHPRESCHHRSGGLRETTFDARRAVVVPQLALSARKHVDLPRRPREEWVWSLAARNAQRKRAL